MTHVETFDQVLDAIEHLPEDQQADIIDVVRRRLAERGRRRVIADVKAARLEHAAGKSREASVDEIMKEIEE
jgi:sirohydrochlorin ferrochelatase